MYPYHSVNSIDTRYPVCNIMLVSYLVSPGPLASVCLYIVLSYRYRLSLPLPIYRNSAGTVFLIVSFPNDNTETFGTIPPQTFISSVFSTPFLLFSRPLFWLSLYSFCSNNTIHTQTGVHSPVLSGVGNDTHETSSQSGPTAVGAGGPFLP